MRDHRIFVRNSVVVEEASTSQACAFRKWLVHRVIVLNDQRSHLLEAPFFSPNTATANKTTLPHHDTARRRIDITLILVSISFSTGMFKTIAPRAQTALQRHSSTAISRTVAPSYSLLQQRIWQRKGYATEAKEHDLVIIGGGVAGYVAAIKAGQEGLSVSITLKS